jgi:hypothetical protein
MVETVTVELVVEIEPKDTLLLRQHIGTITVKETGEKFDISMNIDNKATFFEFKEDVYTVTLKHLCESVINARKKKQG